ncbi:FAD-dependent oxidoreductase [Halomonas sp. MCCC 1A11036]|uniref:FAD-dependent oxidoreductase n=1 Tax=Billgrantia zhangzhouensis TaxID=2733481 RepID=A0ABS9AAU2_9GAMM|nr:NAD(P)/FAD-dependent oxidoreductase [Halomonas zhangzhouensis]MCE8018731.1 FAD-dependent oxidoreductase [Halomonas zhangzhouensis]
MKIERPGSAIDADVVVVGAGLAGLSVASKLAACGRRCILVEAQARAGGRILSVTGPRGSYLEAGAGFFNADMANIIELVQRAGLKTQRGVLDGAQTVLVDLHQPKLREANLSSLLDWESLLEHRISKGMSLHELLDRALSGAEDVRTVQSMMTELMSQEPTRLSAAATLELTRHIPSDRSDMELRADGPLGQVIQYLASHLTEPPRFNWPVQRISIEGDVVVVANNARSLRARTVVLAVPPTAARRIVLPDSVARLAHSALNSFIAGAIVKINATVASPGASAPESAAGRHVVCLDPPGLVAIETALFRDNERSFIIFAGGQIARDLSRLGETEQTAFTRKLLRVAYALSDTDLLEVMTTAWIDDPWTGGGYNAYIGRGREVNAAAQLRTIDGPVIFACSEIADHFPGYMEGAIHAGHQAADAVLATLDGHVGK